jgi:hypothetical protein
MSPIIQDAYTKGYNKGLNQSCLKLFPFAQEEWGDNPSNKKIVVQLNYTFDFNTS